MNNFSKRALTGTAFVIALLSAILIHPYLYITLFALVTLMGLHEFYSLAKKDNSQPAKIWSITAGLYLFISCALYSSGTAGPEICWLNIPVIFSLFIIELYRKKERPFTNVAYSVLGILYVAVPFALINFIVFSARGVYSPHILLGIFFILWASDTGAYLSGMTFGKHKLFERISPKKTWEGSIGGTIICILTAYIISDYFTELKSGSWMVVAVITAIAGTLGDLAESLFKRSINVKDSGTILPGHGGVLDRFDGLLVAAPFIFAYLHFFGH